MTYKVQLPVFEGPLDLLLYLIKKDEVNIYDIPIAKITNEYLDYLEMLKLLDLDIAGEFVLVAATLMHIKSKMLLPPEENDEELVEEIDPREELVSKLLEYKKFKEAAGDLKELRLRHRDSFTRTPEKENIPVEEDEQGFEASLFDLITAFSKVLKEIPREMFHQVIRDEYTVSDKIHDVLHILVEKQVVYFKELFKGVKSRGEIVAIFLAILELTKIKEIAITQDVHCGEIKIMRHAEWQKK
ncbi:MAG: segregation/condensation protein A [Candidatus Omnitrophica bacterium]|nr:segregation/condensation protein A [Candidatus Omnitrophota bacterium]